MKNIEFFTTISGVEDTYPIIESCKFRPSWVSLAKEQYRQKIKAFEDHGQRLFHIYNCPGIFDIMQTGYIICCPWDITIQTTGDYKSFLWNVPSNDINILNSNQPVVGGHSPDDIAEFLPKKHGCMHTIIRISTPWHVVSPPNVKFIIHPIPYSDDDIFEQTLGILDPSISTRLNAQLYWKNIQGSYTIKAGTPLFQIIPLSSEKFTFSVKYASEKQFQWLTKKQYFFNMSFFSKDHILKKLYLKHFWPNFTGTTSAGNFSPSSGYGSSTTMTYQGGTYTLYKFTSVGTFTLNAQPSGNDVIARVTLVGGGGGGSGAMGGGGGAGGVSEVAMALKAGQTYTIIVGAGGTGGGGGGGYPGSSSTITLANQGVYLSATGGGEGRTSGGGGFGGSGGGASAGNQTVGLGIVGQGNNGGVAGGGSNNNAGGGGGASGVGGTGNNQNGAGGLGGAGITCFDGVARGGGGTGASLTDGWSANGGVGGGGAGGYRGATAGTANTGGGGGGSSGNGNGGQSGGSGIVIIAIRTG